MLSAARTSCAKADRNFPLIQASWLARNLDDGHRLDEVLDGRNAGLDDGVQKTLARAPRDFAHYTRATVATGVWGDER